MDPYKETFQTWNNLASLYQDKFMGLDLYNDSYDYICSSIAKPNAKLLEIGCGPGNITKYLLGKRPDFDIFGTDIAPGMVELARQNNPTAEIAVMDSRHINLLDTKFDGIVGGFCLPYLSQSECFELISAAYSLLNDNGLLYLSFVEGDPDKSGFKAGSGGRVYFYYHPLSEIESQLRTCKFVDITICKVGYRISETETETHTIVTAKRKDLLLYRT